MDANIAMLVKERNANNAWHKLARNKTALVGFFIVAFMVVIAVFAPLIAPYDPNAINPILPFYAAIFVALMLVAYVPWFSMALPTLFGAV